MPYGNSAGTLVAGDAERVAGRQPALLHRGRGQAGEADHVADRVDVRHARSGSASLTVQPAAIVDRQAGRRQIERRGRAGPADAVQRRVGDDLLAAGQVDAHALAVLVGDRAPCPRPPRPGAA